MVAGRVGVDGMSEADRGQALARLAAIRPFLEVGVTLRVVAKEGLSFPHRHTARKAAESYEIALYAGSHEECGVSTRDLTFSGPESSR
jgi:hypothetical protein